MGITAIKGFKDILPEETPRWRQVESVARDVFRRFGFEEIRTPILEKTELFARSIGQATDIVEKEMYSFADRNGDSVTLRPEGTASVLRAAIEHSLHLARPVPRLYTIGPMFRHERPQKGRLRQFHQLSIEALGSESPLLDAETIAMARMLLTELAIPARLEINSLGCPACRPGYRRLLTDFLDGLVAGGADLCEDCRRRAHTNPLRVLDCKRESCRVHIAAAPSVLAHLCPACAAHLAAVEDALGRLSVVYHKNPFMVRGLDYYCRTTFEFLSGDLGAQAAIGAGGRYDGLLGQLGGQDLPGFGFAMGMERLILLMEQQETAPVCNGPDLFIAALGPQAQTFAFRTLHDLRQHGLFVAGDLDGKSLKGQMKQAGRLKARMVLILGDDEMTARRAILRNMADGGQEELPWEDEDLSTRLLARLQADAPGKD